MKIVKNQKLATQNFLFNTGADPGGGGLKLEKI
jgi:hypothetical protein